jgi:8-amino-7-oxononanoate synthase
MTSSPRSWPESVAARNAAIADAGRWRTIRTLDGGGPTFELDDGRTIVSFASNDYLGLTQHPLVRAGAAAALQQFGTGSGSARLIVGGRPVHRELEAELASWKDAEAAVLFPTGFAANLGVLTTFATDGVLVVSDELNHASIIDGCRLSRGRVEIARHGDVDHVDALLRGHAGPAIVATDTVFSMDGDVAPLDALVATCARYGALLVLDEAHAVLGPPLPDGASAGVTVLRVGTLSKTLGSLGGFVTGPRPFVDLVVNAARPFIFTTAPTPADTGAALAALRVLRSGDGDALVDRLRAHVERIAPGHPSPIVPVVLGDEQRALDASAHLLQDHGLLVPAIRPPTVPAGTSRLRVALSAAHSDDQVVALAKALADL